MVYVGDLAALPTLGGLSDSLLGAGVAYLDLATPQPGPQPAHLTPHGAQQSEGVCGLVRFNFHATLHGLNLDITAFTGFNFHLVELHAAAAADPKLGQCFIEPVGT